MYEVEEQAMDYEQNINYDKQVVRIVEGIKASEPVPWFRQLNKAPPEPFCCKYESNGHQDDHNYSSHTLNSSNKVDVLGFILSKVINQIVRILIVSLIYKPWEIACEMIAGVEYNTNHNGCSNSLNHRQRENKLM